MQDYLEISLCCCTSKTGIRCPVYVWDEGYLDLEILQITRRITLNHPIRVLTDAVDVL